MGLVVYKDRKNSGCEKWDNLKTEFGSEDLIAAWVADMDFEAPYCVKEALREYVEFGVYGYCAVDDEFYNSFISWEKKYHSYEIQREWIRFIPGVVPAIYWMVQKYADEGEAVIVMPPVYYPFLNSIKETGRKLVECPLVENDGIYSMNFELFEKIIIENAVKVFILCNPHNPVGRVWTKSELKTVLDICKKHEVFVISDEIHQDLVSEGITKITAATVGEYDGMMLTLTSASKSFNIAGFQSAFAIAPDENVRANLDDMIRRIHLNEGGTPGYIAVRAAYENGREWLEEVKGIISKNYKILKEMLNDNLPKAVISPLEGTYLMWINLSAYMKDEPIGETAVKVCKIAGDYGSWFGGEAYNGYLRINLATSEENIHEIGRRLSLLA